MRAGQTGVELSGCSAFRIPPLLRVIRGNSLGTGFPVLQADHEQEFGGRFVVRGGSRHQGGVRLVRPGVWGDHEENGSVATCFTGSREAGSVVVAAAADRVSQRPKNPEHSSDDQQDHPDRPQNRDLEDESENEKNNSESDHEPWCLLRCQRSGPVRRPLPLRARRCGGDPAEATQRCVPGRSSAT
jgi:hypothetical protein